LRFDSEKTYREEVETWKAKYLSLERVREVEILQAREKEESSRKSLLERELREIHIK
jgi:hypothetical protein